METFNSMPNAELYS